MDDKVFHLVIRFSDAMFEVGNVVSRHNSIIDQFGSVWFGKMGQTISQKRIDIINNQIENDIDSYLYLVKGNRRKSTAYKTRIIKISKDPPGDKTLLPDYYSDIGIQKYMKVFIQISKIIEIDLADMEELKAISSIYSIAETLYRSSSGYFLVHER